MSDQDRLESLARDTERLLKRVMRLSSHLEAELDDVSKCLTIIKNEAERIQGAQRS